METEQLFSKVREPFITSFSFLYVLKTLIQCHLNMVFNFTPLESIPSNTLLSASSATAGCSGLCPASEMETPKHLQAASSSIHSPDFFSVPTRNLYFNLCPNTFLIIFLENICWVFLLDTPTVMPSSSVSHTFSFFHLLPFKSHTLFEYQLFHFCGLNE